MEEKLLQIKNDAVSLILDTNNRKALEEIKLQFLGKSGKLTIALKELPHIPNEKKPHIGRLANEVKVIIEETIKEKEAVLKHETQKERTESIDITAPGIRPPLGHLHPMTQVLSDVIDVFKSIGFQAADGPEIETDKYNFEMINIPKNHPARDTQQTLYLDPRDTEITPGEIILRTQTSAMQGRVMEKTKPPLRVIVPGKNFRYEKSTHRMVLSFGKLKGFVLIHTLD
jgi:phenylalanyl-tRNA synthetase alpha chain